MCMFSIRSVWRRQQLWGDGPVRWLTTTIFHTAATVTISLAAPTYGSMQMGHGELRGRFRWGRARGAAETEILRNLLAATKKKTQSDTARNLILATNAVLTAGASRSLTDGLSFQ